ncbi:Leucine efflux protein [Moritella viscosa]|nr:Leucine efflux protein [Moritella viscosa]SHO05230.1 Leucine efflux protein [Moritella viscosa]SHO07294.1 Leucine efflux protein [Moritella viscosa]SHO10730.1 Leucine efflux protein [Moritella viscosa]SHO21382.1 Leucine efflux protein [Moritella viscosa]
MLTKTANVLLNKEHYVGRFYLVSLKSNYTFGQANVSGRA